MTDTQHTPGPWTLSAINTRAGRDKRALRGGGRHICDLSIYDDRDVANARLIAASPKMLDALEHIEWAVTGFGDFEAQYPHVISEIRAAIAEATGRAD